MYAVDSLRQLAMKFLERDELANYSFQNDFLKPFVVVMRLSKAVEIRELIIRCASLHWPKGSGAESCLELSNVYCRAEKVPPAEQPPAWQHSSRSTAAVLPCTRWLPHVLCACAGVSLRWCWHV